MDFHRMFNVAELLMKYVVSRRNVRGISPEFRGNLTKVFKIRMKHGEIRQKNVCWLPQKVKFSFVPEFGATYLSCTSSTTPGGGYGAPFPRGSIPLVRNVIQLLSNMN